MVLKRAGLFLSFLLLAGVADAQLVAERVTTANAATRLFSGSKVVGGVGDWYLSNGIVEVIVDDAGNEADIPVPKQNMISPSGGNLVDVGIVGHDNDQLDQIFQVANLNPSNAFFHGAVIPGVTPSSASLASAGVLLFGALRLPAQTTYSVAPGQPFITITSSVVNNTANPLPLFNITDAVILVGHTTVPFAPFPGRGFNHPKLDLTPAGISAALGIYPYVAFPGTLSPDDGVIDTVTGTVAGEVSYAIVPLSFSIGPTTIPASVLLGVNSDALSGVGNPFNPATSPPLPPGATFSYTRRLLVGSRNDVASVSNLVFGGGPFPTGTVTGNIDAADTPDVRANLIFTGTLAPVFGAAPLPLTQVRTDEHGSFSVTLPVGTYSVAISSPERDDITATVVVSPGTATVPLPTLSATGHVGYFVTEKRQPVPAKLTFLGLQGTESPDFSRYFDAVRFDPVTHQPLSNVDPSSFGGSPSKNALFTDGQGTQAIKPGTYQVIASRGVEYTIARTTITVLAGQTVDLALPIERVIDTSGYVSADFHVHSARSFDSSAPLRDRVRSYVAEGVEVLVSTDHNFITDLAPIVQQAGYGGFLKTIVGDEMTTGLSSPAFPQAFGHHNVFPLLVEPLARRRGAVQTEYVNAATFYDRARAKSPEVQKVIQLNHPRSGLAGLTLIGLFNTIGFNPTVPVAGTLLQQSLFGTGTRNIDFDALEIYNAGNVGQYLQSRNDWFSLLNQGYLRTATAVSDSHRVVMETAGMPRSYVAAPTDEPSELTDSMITSGVLSRNVLGTSGPFIRFTIDNHPIGSLVTAKNGTKLEIIVYAPAWVPVDEVRIFANGQPFATFDRTTHPTVTDPPSDPTAKQGIKRFNASVRVNPSRDTAYVIEAGARLPFAIDTDGDGVVDRSDTNGDGVIDGNDTGIAQPPSPEIYAAVAPGFVPLAFTNPIFVDADGNGRFDPPGLPAAPTLAMKLPHVAPEPHGSDDLLVLSCVQITPDVMNGFDARMDAVRK
jgi:hypothetical protein